MENPSFNVLWRFCDDRVISVEARFLWLNLSCFHRVAKLANLKLPSIQKRRKTLNEGFSMYRENVYHEFLSQNGTKTYHFPYIDFKNHAMQTRWRC